MIKTCLRRLVHIIFARRSRSNNENMTKILHDDSIHYNINTSNMKYHIHSSDRTWHGGQITQLNHQSAARGIPTITITVIFIVAFWAWKKRSCLYEVRENLLEKIADCTRFRMIRWHQNNHCSRDCPANLLHCTALASISARRGHSAQCCITLNTCYYYLVGLVWLIHGRIDELHNTLRTFSRIAF